MSLLALVLLSLALSLDCFTICLIYGMQRSAFRQLLKEGEKDSMPPLALIATQAGLLFAVFHILMILTGWFLGLGLAGIVQAFDHWVAFALLSGIGLKNFIEAFSQKDLSVKTSAMFHPKSLLLLALATSIDAFAVGISLKMLDASLLQVCTCVPVAVFICSLAGVFIGFFLQKQMKKVSPRFLNILGGLVLIGIGVRILIEHLTA